MTAINSDLTLWATLYKNVSGFIMHDFFLTVDLVVLHKYV